MRKRVAKLTYVPLLSFLRLVKTSQSKYKVGGVIAKKGTQPSFAF